MINKDLQESIAVELRKVFPDTPIYTSMPEGPERNEHFKGFAKLLWQDLLNANGMGYIDVNTDDDGVDPTDYLAIIAQRAFDLAVHVMEHTSEWLAAEREVEFISAQDAVNEYIPDLTEWPKDQT